MDDNQTSTRLSTRLALGAGLLVAGAVAGGVLAGTLTASATSDSAGTAAVAGYGAADASGVGMDHHGGSVPVRSDELAASTSVAAKLKAAALKAVPGGTVYRVETDAGNGAYEAHMTRPDGTAVTVKLDSAYKVIRVETGMGKGDPHLGGPSR